MDGPGHPKAIFMCPLKDHLRGRVVVLDQQSQLQVDGIQGWAQYWLKARPLVLHATVGWSLQAQAKHEWLPNPLWSLWEYQPVHGVASIV
uniref:Uncharacterized protein n=1 Tax=Oryza sativa subsp. japonica TaxID=39947 RepID=Q6ESU9_ORYSJ|nr:hypothetical protein [Oryza sativa Japonica Group]